MIMKAIILTTLFVLCTSLIYAQTSKKQFYFNANLGPAVGLFDRGFGYHAELMPGVKLAEKVDMVSQLSFATIDIESALFSNRKGVNNTAKVLLGPRVYFSKGPARFRTYTNILFGIDFREEVRERDRIQYVTSNRTLGVSSGIYVLHRSGLNCGLAFETPGVYILKFGYHF